MQVYIDGDACPVKEIAISLCAQYHIPITILMDDAHEYVHDYATVIIVERGFDHVDHALFMMANKGDLAITQDYGLAAILLGKKVDVLNQDGVFYTDNNIDFLMDLRYFNAMQRRKEKRYTHHAKRSIKQDECFEDQLGQHLKMKCSK